jgi:hypothetical protein
MLIDGADMLLKELATSPYKFTHGRENFLHTSFEVYKFNDGNIQFITHVDIIPPFEDGRPGYLEIMFMAKPLHKDGEPLKLKDAWSDQITGTGNSIRVFSTILAVLKDAIKRNPDYSKVIFSAKETEPSRIKLYSRFADNVGKYLPGWKLSKVKPNAKMSSGNPSFVYMLEKS